MSPIQSMLIWMAGHSPSQCRSATPAEKWSLARAGLLVTVAFLVAAMNWGVVGWVFTEHISGEARWFLTALIMLAGSGIMVLLLDRSFLFMMDSASPKKGIINAVRNGVFALFRIALILGFGTLAAQFTMPLFLGNELSASALAMIEEKETKRSRDLARVNGLDDQIKAAKSASKIVDNWEAALVEGKSVLDQKNAAVRDCWRRWENSVRYLTTPYVSRDAARRYPGPQRIAAECSAASESAKQQLAQLEKTREDHRLAIEAQAAAQSQVDETNRQIAETMAERGAIDKSVLTAKSATVLGEALKNDPGAFAKWALITALLTALELLPFIVKLLGGSSIIGARIAAEHDEARGAIEAKRNQHRHALANHERIAAATNQAMIDAVNSAEVQTALAEHLSAYVSALGPQEGLRALMLELATTASETRDFLARHPQYATLISQAMERAIRESTEALAGIDEKIAEHLHARAVDPDVAAAALRPS